MQQNGEDRKIAYVPYKPRRDSFWESIDPSRMAVPMYQNWMRVSVLALLYAWLTDLWPILKITIWLIFLFVYSQAVQEPLEMTLDPRHAFDAWEYILYGMALAFSFEGMCSVPSPLMVLAGCSSDEDSVRP